MIKFAVPGLLLLTTLSVTAENAILEETLALDDQAVSKVLLRSCDVEVKNVTDENLRAQAKNQRLMQINVSGKRYYAPSFALFERDEGKCELIIQGLLRSEE